MADATAAGCDACDAVTGLAAGRTMAAGDGIRTVVVTTGIGCRRMATGLGTDGKRADVAIVWCTVIGDGAVEISVVVVETLVGTIDCCCCCGCGWGPGGPTRRI